MCVDDSLRYSSSNANVNARAISKEQLNKDSDKNRTSEVSDSPLRCLMFCVRGLCSAFLLLLLLLSFEIVSPGHLLWPDVGMNDRYKFTVHPNRQIVLLLFFVVLG